MFMVERLSAHDDTLIGGYGVHIQRYQFALSYCREKNVLDAGCGIGYGSIYLARSGAASVTAVDLSAVAIKEASETYHRSNLSFSVADVEKLDQCKALPPRIDTIVNYENIEHLPHPKEFLGHARRLLAKPDGVLLTSTPNGDISELDPTGKPYNPFHVKEFKPGEFMELLTPYFSKVTLYGQWQTYDGRLRLLRGRQLHQQLCEMYYNPVARAGRLIKKILGKSSLPPPEFTGGGDAFSIDYTIAPLDDPPFHWPPTVLIAVCTG
jgi:2-polyprenyl-3-methyl-5-hydroxy-6-metoxy-1,4-benzoquinol methylase